MTRRAVPLTRLARVIRSKNAGPYELTLDVIFRDRRAYRHARDCGFFTPARVAALYRTTPDRVRAVIFFEPALALKITLLREPVSGAPGDTDIYGAQQHAPLLAVRLPAPPARRTGGGKGGQEQ